MKTETHMARMTPTTRFELVHSGPYKFHARFVAANNEIVWVTESLRTRRAALEAIAILQAAPIGALEVKAVDER